MTLSILLDLKIRFSNIRKLMIDGLVKNKTYPEAIQIKLAYLERIKNHICRLNKINPDIKLVVLVLDTDGATAFVSHKVIFFDKGLMNKFSNKELAAVLAHEIGHIKEKTFLRSILLSYALPLSLMSLLVPLINYLPEIPIDLAKDNDLVISICSIFVTCYLIDLFFRFCLKLCSYIFCWFSRQEEFRCDLFAARCIGVKTYLQQSFLIDCDYLRKNNLFYKLAETHPMWDHRRAKVLASLKK